MASQETIDRQIKAAESYNQSTNKAAYLRSKSPSVIRLINRGRVLLNQSRITPLQAPRQQTPRQQTPRQQTPRQQTPQRDNRGRFVSTQAPTTSPTPKAPRGRRQFVGTTSRTTTANTKANINGRLGRPLNFVGSLAQTYYLTITPVKDRFGNYQPFRSNIELRELLGKQHYPFFDRNKFYSVRVVVDFESGASKGGSIASQLYNNSTDLQNNILGLVITGFNNYGAIAQIEIEIIETTP